MEMSERGCTCIFKSDRKDCALLRSKGIGVRRLAGLQ